MNTFKNVFIKCRKFTSSKIKNAPKIMCILTIFVEHDVIAHIP